MGFHTTEKRKEQRKEQRGGDEGKKERTRKAGRGTHAAWRFCIPLLQLATDPCRCAEGASLVEKNGQLLRPPCEERHSEFQKGALSNTPTGPVTNPEVWSQTEAHGGLTAPHTTPRLPRLFMPWAYDGRLSTLTCFQLRCLGFHSTRSPLTRRLLIANRD